MKPGYKRAAVVVKPHKDVVPYLKKTIELLKKLQVGCVLEDATAELIGLQSDISRERIADGSDIIIVIGGDGTLLSVAGQALNRGIPIAGFNMGSLGFLTELSKDSLEKSLEDIFLNKPTFTERTLLEIRFQGHRYIALNDVVVSKGYIARIIRLMLVIDHQEVAEMRADGIIISTPTGSTAYSLSAGGPIVAPEVNGLVITPLCPHSLTLRPFVIPDSSHIRVKLMSRSEEVTITMDGQRALPMSPGDTFDVNILPAKLKLITSRDMNYFRLLYEKLNWSL